MAITPDSASSAYASASDLSARYDVRVLCQLASDDDEALDEADLAANAKVLAALKTASGRVEASVLKGQRYTAANLGQLTGVASDYLKGLVCDLAFERLRRRRPEVMAKPAPAYTEALEDLKGLGEGALLFGTVEHEEAGLPELTVETPTEVETRNLTTYQANRLYGRRSNRRTAY